MNPTLKYAIARVGLFIAVALPLVVLAPKVNILLKLMIAVIVSALLAWFFLRGLRDEVAQGMLVNRERRLAEKEKLRAALAGDDEPAEPGSAESGSAEPGNAEPANGEPSNAEPGKGAPNT